MRRAGRYALACSGRVARDSLAEHYLQMLCGQKGYVNESALVNGHADGLLAKNRRYTHRPAKRRMEGASLREGPVATVVRFCEIAD